MIVGMRSELRKITETNVLFLLKRCEKQGQGSRDDLLRLLW